jgi:hypothetical protein
MLTAAYVSSFDSGNEIKARGSPFISRKENVCLPGGGRAQVRRRRGVWKSGFDSPLLQ